jgi:hypothetical protein
VHGFDYGDINPDYQPPSPWPVVEYEDPGGWTTIDVSEHELEPDTDVDAAVAIAKIIADTEGRRRLFFPAGTYTLKSSLWIRVGDIWLDGEGKETRFVLDFEEGKEYNGIIFKGYGNVWECVSDLYHKDYYANSPKEDPTGWTQPSDTRWTTPSVSARQASTSSRRRWSP